MTPLILLGWILATLGSVLGIAGAIGTSDRDEHRHHTGFLCWTLNSPCLVISMIGVAAGWFEPVSVVILVPLNLFYWVTAIRGWRNTA